jgi:hypothetical protein
MSAGDDTLKAGSVRGLYSPSAEPRAGVAKRGFGLSALIEILDGVQGRAEYRHLAARLREQLTLVSGLAEINLRDEADPSTPFDPRWDV